MNVLNNPYRSLRTPLRSKIEDYDLDLDVTDLVSLLKLCPVADKTPIHRLDSLAHKVGIKSLFAKDERVRMGLGSFKAVGAAYVIAREANMVQRKSDHRMKSVTLLNGRTFVCASAGNHGLSVAAASRVFGASAVIYVHKYVPNTFRQLLRNLGAKVVQQGESYDDSMLAADNAAKRNGWTLLSDSSWPGYFEIPKRVMHGYLTIGLEVTEAIKDVDDIPSHIFLQAGVGGFASAMAAWFRSIWHSMPKIVIVEPDAAPGLFVSIQQGKPTKSSGPVSNMGRLDCKAPSHIAYYSLARDADFFVTITDREAEFGKDVLAAHRINTTCSGAAGFAVLLDASNNRNMLGLCAGSRALVFVTERSFQ
jgi:diaminopropionate ammonia-lyase